MTYSTYPLHHRLYVGRLQPDPVVSSSHSIIPELILSASLTGPIPPPDNRSQTVTGIPKRLQPCYYTTQLLLRATSQTLQMSYDAHFECFVVQQALIPVFLILDFNH